MRKIFVPLIVIVISFGLLSCGRSDNSGSSLQPNVSGSTGEVVVVLDKAKWDGNRWAMTYKDNSGHRI